MREIQIDWKGVESYDSENDSIIPEDAGVYEILTKNKESGYNRMYVGETDDLNRRFNEHLSDEEENEDIKNGLENEECGFDFALIDDEDNRFDAEQGLYDEYKYLWNQKRPAGSGDEDYSIEESE